MKKMLMLNKLEQTFETAKKINIKHVAIGIKFEDLDGIEVIVNPLENADEKLKYYKDVYDKNGVHKYSKNIRIVAVAAGDNVKHLYDNIIKLANVELDYINKEEANE